MLKLFREQPRAFSMIFMLELWERFGFYTVQGILTLYFIRMLGYDDTQAYYTFGAFSALVYGLVVLGGYLGDKFLGTKRTIALGLVTLALGYTALALSSPHTVFWALGLVCVGNGLFKANPSNLLAKCYEDNDARLHGGFTLYYMAINLGSTVALIAGPSLASSYGYSYAYLLAAIGLVAGLANYVFQYRLVAHVNTEADKRKLSLTHWLSLLLGILVLTWTCAWLLQQVMLTKTLVLYVSSLALVGYFYYMSKENKASRMKMLVALILMIEAVVFFTLYQQMPTSLNLFAVNNVISNVLGISIDPQSFQALNPLWIILMSPVLAIFYRKIHRKGFFFSVPYKFAMGMTLSGLSFYLLYFTRYFCSETGMVSSWWLVSSYLFQSLGELLVSALGVAMVAELVPAAIAGFVMGIWFLTSALAGFSGAFVASIAAIPANVKPGVDSLLIYTDLFQLIGLVTLGVSVLMWAISPWLSRFITKPPVESLDLEDPEEIEACCIEGS